MLGVKVVLDVEVLGFSELTLFIVGENAWSNLLVWIVDGVLHQPGESKDEADDGQSEVDLDVFFDVYENLAKDDEANKCN